MRRVLLLMFGCLELAAMQQVEIPGDTTAVAKSIIMQAGRPETKTNVTALIHTLGAIQANPVLPNPERGRLSPFESLKVRMNKFLMNPKMESAVLSPGSSTGLIVEAEKLVDEAVDFWAGNTADAVIAHKRQKIAAIITSAVALTGNAVGIGLAIYYGLNSKPTTGS